MIDGPPLMQPHDEIKHLHVTCLAKGTAPLEAEIAHSARGPCNRDQIIALSFGLNKDIAYDIAYDMTYDILCNITYDIAVLHRIRYRKIAISHAIMQCDIVYDKFNII